VWMTDPDRIRHHTTREDPNHMTRKTIAVLTAAGALALPATAGAHVTIQPTEAQAGGFARLDVRVPNERDDAGTTKVAVKIPPGIFFASYEPQDGWGVEIKKRKLDQPKEVFGEEQTEEVDTITFTGRGDDQIGPGQFVDFGLSVNVPEGDAGTQLKFPATQTYSSGEVVRWIRPEDAEEPAPLVTLTAAESEATDSHGGAQESAGISAAEVDDKADKSLAVGALVVGGLGLLAGIGALVASRRSRPAA
jgi:periplasmic copper chaperone A